MVCTYCALARLLAGPQEELDTHVLWLIIALEEMKRGNPAFAGRLKAAALQLLPPVLDNLHARRLSGLSDVGLSATEGLQQLHIELNLVGTVPPACTGMSTQCFSTAQRR